MAVYNDMQLIKREFFARRNGVIVDTLRRAGVSYKVIFGLTLPQIREIADAAGKNVDLAERLWENRTTRESAMLAPYLFPDDYVNEEYAVRLVNEAPTAEIVDVLCMACLRRQPYAVSLAGKLFGAGNKYASLRLYLNLMLIGRIKDKAVAEHIAELAEKESGSSDNGLRIIANQIKDELPFLNF